MVKFYFIYIIDCSIILYIMYDYFFIIFYCNFRIKEMP